MPIECSLLAGEPVEMHQCPKCGDKPLRPFLRGMVQRSPYTWRTLWLPFGKPRPYCCVICWKCKEIVGYE